MSAKDAVITIDLLERLTKKVHGPAIMHGDNQPSLVMAKRHVAMLNYHIIWDFVQQGKIVLQFVRSIDQPADALTEALAAIQFIKHRDKLLNCK